MENEKLKVFDENRNPIGAAARSDVHKFGLWHEVFHCWFIRREKGTDYIYLQIRSARKKDFPNLLDITAAGHLLVHETVSDGLREVVEEIGITLSMNELVPLGVISYCSVSESMVNKEFAHVFLYESNHSFDEFILQDEEVSGIIRLPFTSFHDLWLSGLERVQIEGFQIQEGCRLPIVKSVTKSAFVQYDPHYIEKVLTAIRDYLDVPKNN